MKKIFRWVLIPLCLATLLLLPSCYPSLGVSVDTNVGGFFQTTNVSVINATPYTFKVLVDGKEMATLGSYGKISLSLWNGNYGSEVSISVVNKDFAHTEKIWVYSSTYSGRYSYVLTIREDKYRGLWVERK